jgi:CBS domain-containing protein
MFDFDVCEIGDGRDAESSRTRLIGETPALSTIRMDVPVGEIPRGPALSVSPEAGVAAAMEAMRRRGLRAAVVVQNHRPIGVITDREILQSFTDAEEPGAVAVGSVMTRCDRPLRDSDTVADALREMCARRQWHLPMVCRRGLFLGALDLADISLWLRDRMTLISVDAAFAGAGVSS